MDEGKGQKYFVIIGIFVAYCLIGAFTFLTYKRIDPDDYDEWGGMSGAFWPITWIVGIIQLLLFCWNKLLDIAIELPKEKINERKAKKRLKAYHTKLINEASDEELGKLIYEGKIKL